MQQLDSNQKISLLGFYLSALPPRWSAQQTYIAMYFTIVLAIFGFSASQFVEVSKASLQVILCAPLSIAAIVSWYAVRSIARQERHIRELIVVTAKLEHSLGLYNRFNPTEPNEPWPNDDHFLPEAWINARLAAGNKSADFINLQIGGTAKIASAIFQLFAYSALILMAMALVAQFGGISRILVFLGC